MSKKPHKVEVNGEKRLDQIKTERLPSLFSQTRDLSLTKTNQRAQAVNKKSYVPNLNVTRNKNADKTGDESTRNQKSERGGRGTRGRGGKNNNANRQNSHLVPVGIGLFSEGIAAAPLTRKSEYGGSSRDTSASDILQKPRIVKKDQKPDKVDLDAEQRTLSDLLGEGDDELNLDEDSKTSSSDDFLPYKIKDPNKSSESNSKKLDIKIKVEPVDDVVMGNSESPDASLNGTAIKTEPGIKSEAFHRLDPLFNATPSEFMLLQLPDALPGRGPEAMETDQPSTSAPNPILCNLEHLDEGLVGKLVRYRSGKTKLILGGTVYDIDPGLTSDFQQHAVTINANPAERSASMYSLGTINAKYNVTPDWIHLFHKMTP